VAVSGGGHGANVGAGIAGGEAQQFVRKEGVTFDGKRTPDYGLKWTWRADLKVVKDGLEDRCKFSLTIPSLDKLEGVKVHFKVIATVVHSSSWWRQKRITLPPHKKLPPHELELHFNDTMPSELT
jgi:hypothetical protein